MAYSSPSTQVTGYLVTASDWNELVNNMKAMAPDVYTTAGDINYATGADALTRLAIGSAAQILRTNSGADAPEWDSLASIMDIQYDEVTTRESTASTTYTDLSTNGPEITITVRSSGKVALFFGTDMETSDSIQLLATVYNGGAEVVTKISHLHPGSNLYDTACGFDLVTGYTPGDSETFTMKYRISSSGTGYFDDRRLLAIAL